METVLPSAEVSLVDTEKSGIHAENPSSELVPEHTKAEEVAPEECSIPKKETGDSDPYVVHIEEPEEDLDYDLKTESIVSKEAETCTDQGKVEKDVLKDSEDAASCILNLDGTEFNGTVIKVEVTDKEPVSSKALIQSAKDPISVKDVRKRAVRRRFRGELEHYWTQQGVIIGRRMRRHISHGRLTEPQDTYQDQRCLQLLEVWSTYDVLFNHPGHGLQHAFGCTVRHQLHLMLMILELSIEEGT
ncbi:unnamed protein product [Dibothriocephalus latus]|uniref:Uncharacterized protein n=1 Tax=Dibothriocephalus latus TaxID=60516 RepID=A0A3P7LUZ5_DIBLA|nr:unnamed protein product [Dibothriocephalus latus]